MEDEIEKDDLIEKLTAMVNHHIIEDEWKFECDDDGDITHLDFYMHMFPELPQSLIKQIYISEWNKHYGIKNRIKFSMNNGDIVGKNTKHYLTQTKKLTRMRNLIQKVKTK